MPIVKLKKTGGEMVDRKTISAEELLNIAEVEEITSPVNRELIERRRKQPLICDVFKHRFTFLKEDAGYRFEVDREARKQLPDIIENKVQTVAGTDSSDDAHAASYLKRRNIGIVFSGGPAPGGHNVVAGVWDAAHKANPDTKIFGFILGPDGIIENEAIELTNAHVDAYRNLGGFTMLKTGRTKIDTPQKMILSRETCKNLELDALVIVGGDDSNTNAAFLAQDLMQDGVQVIGVPKTIDGDIQVRDAAGHVLCAVSFGFHTAARAFAYAISNLCTDASSDVKYWHICKVMGRVASHLALEVALQTHANITIIGEELADFVDRSRIKKAKQQKTVDFTAYGMTLRHLSRVICDAIVRRAEVGKNFGVIVLPEGVLEFINEIQVFIIKLNTIISEYNTTHDTRFHNDFPLMEDKLEHLRRLAKRSREDSSFTVWNTRDDDLFNDIPEFFREGLLTERDAHGNFQFSQVETDKVIMGLVKDYLDILKEEGIYRLGIKREYYQKTMKRDGLDPDFYGPILFENYKDSAYLLRKSSIISLKTLEQALMKAKALKKGTPPPALVTIYKKSVPRFKTQTHFYGYDGRGSDPTRFDCNYTYNLGLTVFSLIANGASGQMAAIKNLEQDFVNWEPIGIPIAPLMHLEERQGKLVLVIEKSIVDVDSNACKVVRYLREKWLAARPGDDDYRRSGPIRFGGQIEEDRPITLKLNAVR